MLRIHIQIGTQGVHDGRAFQPAGWKGENARASRVSAGTGMQVARLTIDGVEALEVRDDAGSAFWVIPQRQLAILNIANPGGSAVTDLPGMLLKGIEVPAPAQ